MANWKKVLVEGADINVGQITGSGLQLTGFSTANQVLVVSNTDGNITAINQSDLEGSSQSFLVNAGVDPKVTHNANGDLLSFVTSSNQGFSFTVSDLGGGVTSSVSLTAPQDLRTTANVQFNEVKSDTFKASTNNTQIQLSDTSISQKIGPDEFNPFSTIVFNPETETQFASVIFGQTTKNYLFALRTKDDNSLFVTTGSQIGIGASQTTIQESPTAKFIITPSTTDAGSTATDLFVRRGAISASAIPEITSSSPGATTILTYDTEASGAFKFISGSGLLSALGTQISGAFDAASASIASDIDDLEVSITANADAISSLSIPNISALEASASKGIRFQSTEGVTTNGQSVPLTQTSSFVGTANEVDVAYVAASPSESKLTFGLPDNVTISDSLTVTNDIVATNITASGDISASGDLTVTGDITLDGTLSFSGLSFIQNQAIVVSGSTSFGSGSLPSEASHTFTGSVEITGSLEVADGPTTLQSTTVTSLSATGDVTLGNNSEFDDLTVNATPTFNAPITASGAISASGDLFANLTEENHPDLVVYDTDTGQFFRTASSAIQGTNTIGPAGDEDYTDGLFDTFNDSTPTGTAIDLINEVLAGLAPSQAPDLAGLDVIDNGVDANMSYGSSNPNNANTSVTSDGLTTPNSALLSVDINEKYDDDGEEGGQSQAEDLRVGVVDARSGFTTINGALNEHVAADGDISAGQFINFNENAFKDGDKGVLALVVNGTTVHTQSLSGSYGGFKFGPDLGSGHTGNVGESLNSNNSGFVSLSATSSAHFTGTGNALDVFKHRSGSYQIGPNDQRNGWNYAFIEHRLDSTVKRTTYVEWVNEINNDALASTDERLTLTVGSQVKVLSGVNYITGDAGYTGEYRATVTNAYRDVYHSGTTPIRFVFDANGSAHKFTNLIKTGSRIKHSSDNDESVTLSAGTSLQKSLPQLEETLIAPSGSTLQLTASYQVFGNDRAIVASNSTTFLNIDGQVFHPIKSPLGFSLDNRTKTGILFDNRTDDSDRTFETFVSESFRLPSGSYDTQASVDTGVGAYPGGQSLASTGGTDGARDGLLVHPGEEGAESDISNTGNGSLIYPTRGLDNYNGITHKPADTNPNYTSLNTSQFADGRRMYMRAFQNGTSVLGSTTIRLKGDSATIVDFSTALSADNSNIHVALKLPPVTAFLDLALPKPGGIPLLTDGLGCRIGNLTNVIATGGVTNEFGFNNGASGGGTINASDYIICKLTVGNNFTGYIKEIFINNFGISHT
jgi:hypothetical protein